MGYRKFEEKRELKRDTISQPVSRKPKEVARNEITDALAGGESIIHLMAKHGWNAVVKATHTPKRTGARKRDADIRV